MNLLEKLAKHKVAAKIAKVERKKWLIKKQTFFPLIEDEIVMMPTRAEAERYITKKYRLLFSNPGNQYTSKELMFRAMDRLHYEVNTKLKNHERPFKFHWSSTKIGQSTEEWVLKSSSAEEVEPSKELIKFVVSK
ncbi:MAG: hypothetical protein IKG72_13090 [Bacillus sp. (in: Bacteria)]|nr:hypothetical protein [Parasporobacterium sp.]MBR3381018.1 hypothetical protein [Bacillus sp. (in: firmicutes)]